MRRLDFASPAGRQRRSLLLIAIAALLAGVGALIRAIESPGSASHSLGYLFDAVGWVLALIAAVAEARIADLFFQFSERKARRRALVLTLVGLTGAIAGCFVASAVVERESVAIVTAVANAVMVGGVAAGLAGLFSLGWFYGGNYAAKRVEKLSEEEW